LGTLSPAACCRSVVPAFGSLSPVPPWPPLLRSLRVDTQESMLTAWWRAAFTPQNTTRYPRHRLLPPALAFPMVFKKLGQAPPSASPRKEEFLEATVTFFPLERVIFPRASAILIPWFVFATKAVYYSSFFLVPAKIDVFLQDMECWRTLTGKF